MASRVTAHQTLVLFGLALGAFIVPLVCNQIRLPSAVGEIAFGVLLGQALGLHTFDQLVTTFADIGFLLLMFSAGTELNLKEMERRGWGGLIGAAAVVMCSFAGGAWYWQVSGRSPITVLLVGAMSIGVATPVLREMGLIRTPLGQTVLVTGAVGEICTLLLLATYDLASRLGLGLQDLAGLAKLAALFFLTLAAVALLRRAMWWFPERFQRLAREEEPLEVGVRGMLAMLFAFAAFARWLGIEAILAAFLAGLVIGIAFPNRGVLETKLSGASYGLFVPIFFISVGFQLDLGELSRGGIWLVIQVAAVSVVARVAPALLLRLAGLDLRQSLAAGLFLCAPFTMFIAIARLGQDVGSLSSGAASALVLYAALSSAAAPIAARAMLAARSRQPAARAALV
ncbi:MAG: cation:proton antiporter [Chloroflexota bacterium]